MRNYIKNDNRNTFIVFEEENNAKVDTVALGMLENNDICGMLPFSVTHIDKMVRAKADVTSFITVTGLLKKTLSKDVIVTVAETVLKATEQCEEYMIKPESVILDPDLMFYDEKNGKLHLCVSPFINDEEQAVTVKDFLKKFICEVKTDDLENCDYIGKMLCYLNSEDDFDPEKLIKLITPENEEPSVIPEPVIIPEETVTENSCEKVIKNESTSVISDLDDLADDCDYSDDVTETDKGKGFLWGIFGDISKKSAPSKTEPEQDDDLLMARFGENKGVFSKIGGDQETVVLKKNTGKKKTYLVRLSSNEKIELKGNRFRIGSEKRSVDYCIDDNCAISRVHAEIIRKNGSYYIVDNNSTNHTFVDDHKLRGKKEYKLSDSSKIILADEEFMFCM